MDAIDGELSDSIAFMQTELCSSPSTSPLVPIDENKCITPQSGTSLVPDSVETCTAVMSSPIGTTHTIETIHSSNRGVLVLEPPKVGMIFKNWEDVESYYKEYAEQVGFGVTRCQWSSSKKDKNVKLQCTWRCECWGPPNLRARREANKRAKAMSESGTGGVVNGVIGEDELARGKRKSKKCFCLAMLYAGVTAEGSWEFRKVELNHVHEVNPNLSKLVKEYRMKKYTATVKRRLANYFGEGVPVRKIHGCLAADKGGAENMPSVKDLQHEVYKERRLKMQGGDAAAMMRYFEYMQRDNQNFYHASRLDEEGRLKDVMWVDARSRVAYEDFGDAVCFDATYLTNEYELPFANFVGVNHHGQSILLGCALVSHETTETYVWVFEQWLLAMNNKAPQAILTDQAPAMRRALAEVMPGCRHRWCIWHIMKKLPEKLGKLELYNDFKNPLKAVIYESFTAEEFESSWCALMKEYDLEGNDWLEGLYDERHMWVPAFMKEYFWAGMKTTQRVESINSFFDGFVTRKTKLFEFPQQYCKALEKRVEDETTADDKGMKYVRRLVSGFRVEKLFQKIYTDAKFQEVQQECARMLYVVHHFHRQLDETNWEYVMEDRVWIVPEGSSEEKLTERRRMYSVKFNSVTKEVKCDCCKFETFGILCKHSIRVLDQNYVKDLPNKYILDRWRKDVPRKHVRVVVPYHDPTKSIEVKRFNLMLSEYEAVFDEAATADDATVEIVMNTLAKLKNDVKESMEKFRNRQLIDCSELPPPSEIGSNSQQRLNGCTPTSAFVLDHEVVGSDIEVCVQPPKTTPVKDPKILKRPRGRPKGSRNKSLAETGFKLPTSKQAVNKKSVPRGQVPNVLPKNQNKNGNKKRATKDGDTVVKRKRYKRVVDVSSPTHSFEF